MRPGSGGLAGNDGLTELQSAEPSRHAQDGLTGRGVEAEFVYAAWPRAAEPSRKAGLNDLLRWHTSSKARNRRSARPGRGRCGRGRRQPAGNARFWSQPASAVVLALRRAGRPSTRDVEARASTRCLLILGTPVPKLMARPGPTTEPETGPAATTDARMAVSGWPRTGTTADGHCRVRLPHLVKPVDRVALLLHLRRDRFRGLQPPRGTRESDLTPAFRRAETRDTSTRAHVQRS